MANATLYALDDFGGTTHTLVDSNYNFLYESRIFPAASCTQDGKTLASGTSFTFYSSRTVAAPALCSSVALSRTCTNGGLSGATSFQYAACTGSGDTTAPTVSLSAPAAGNVSGTVTISATASDNVGVAGVQFKLDGANLGAEDTVYPYSYSWNTTNAFNGARTLTAVARDAAGNTKTSAGVSVTVGNVDVGASCTLDGKTLASGASFTFYSSRSVAAPALCSSVALSRTCTNGTLSGSASFQYAACTASGDTTAPTVSITAPASGATVSGTATISANASDNIGVAGVQFKLDGANLGAEDTVYPYSYSWNTTNAFNGARTLTAVARDAAGNTKTSAGVPITVSNTPPPSQFSGGFSGTQGSGGWYYQYKNGQTYGDLTWNAASSTWEFAGTYPRILKAGPQLIPSISYDAVLKWVAPQAGGIVIAGTVKDLNATCGDDAIARILKNSQSLWQQGIANGDSAGKTHSIPTTVVKGDAIYFEVNKGAATNYCDNIGWDPSVTYTSAAGSVSTTGMSQLASALTALQSILSTLMSLFGL